MPSAAEVEAAGPIALADEPQAAAGPTDPPAETGPAAAPPPPAMLRSSGPTLRDRIAGFTFLGIGPKGFIRIAIVAAVIAGVAIWLSPGEGIDVGEARIVDCYTAMRGVRHAKALEIINITPIVGTVSRNDTLYERSMLYGGTDRINVVMDSADSDFIAIPVSISEKYIMAHGGGKQWTFILENTDFELIAGDQKITAVMLAQSYPDFVRVDLQATMELAGFEFDAKEEAEEPAFPVYPPVVERPSGMRLQYSRELEGRLQVLRWNQPCQAWRVTEFMELTRGELGPRVQDLLLIFERPKTAGQPMTLIASGDEVATIPAALGR